MQQPDAITMCPPSSISPSICPAFHLCRSVALSLSLTHSLSLSALSAAAITAKFYRVSHLNRQNISPGIQPQWAACLAAAYLSIKERHLIRLKDHQLLGRMTHKETQTNIYLQHKHPLLLFNCGPLETLDLIHCCWGGIKKTSMLCCNIVQQYSLCFVCVCVYCSFSSGFDKSYIRSETQED